ncbi:MAG: cytochrome c maturation protein CcmE [Sorangiineae bacterium]|nr:cytochrome c maturation protein CcmE [Polyangiaceae bacterium]MEB2323036.1 cytochrome c maturation protein CcmE [Sorangiineae bacterium]
MSRLDDELAEAVDAIESGHPVPVAVTAPPRPPAPKRNLALLAALLVMGGGILTLVLTSFNDSAVYSKNVDELLAERSRLEDRAVRVTGVLVKGTLVHRDQPCEYRFKMSKNGAVLDVRYAQCVVPDTFRDMPGMDVEVTAEGKLTEGGGFEADQIMAKCPSKYEMKDRENHGEKAPHTAVSEAERPSGS